MAEIIQEAELFFTEFEPLLKNRFIMYLDGLPTYMVRRIGRPRLTQPAKKINHINVSRYIHGKTEWEPISMTLYEPIAPSGAQAIMEWELLHHESVTGRDGYAAMYKKDITIDMLGPVGDVVQQWVLKGCIITNLDFGEANLDTDDLTEITLEVQPDFCVLAY